MNMNDFTLIVPTHNRHHYIKRSIDYFKDLNAPVIYCDSSSEEYKGIIPPSIVYLHMPNLKFAEKILKAISIVHTTKIALCADDDFILIESLYKGDVFLNSNDSYSTVVGQYAGFKRDFDGTFFEMYKWCDLDNNINYDVIDNAKTFFSNYHQILWAMYRKEVVETAFDVIVKSEFKNDNFIELTIGAIACYKGGIKILKDLWGIREVNSDDHWAVRHLPLTIAPKEILVKDSTNFRTNIDSIIFDGYAETVLNSYLGNQTYDIDLIIRKIKSLLPNSFIKYLKEHFFKNKVRIKSIKSEYIPQLDKLSILLRHN